MPFVFRQLDISTDVLDLADKHDFEIRGYAFDAFTEDVRAPRKVKVGVIQNKMVLPTTATVLQQVSDVTLACNVPLALRLHNVSSARCSVRAPLGSDRSGRQERSQHLVSSGVVECDWHLFRLIVGY